jgi:hypothetical protein
MRTARAIPIGLALALAPGVARAERVSLRLEYTRGPGGEACPAEPAALRAALLRSMGYDPFDRPRAARERLTVVLVPKGDGYAAKVERFNAAGVSTWSETFPKDGWPGECAALTLPLASELRAVILVDQDAPAAPPHEPAAPVPTPPPAPPAPPPELRAPPPEPAKPPEPPNVPNPAHTTARTVAIVSSSTGAILLGFGIGFAVDAQSKAHSAQALAEQPNPVATDSGCKSAGAPGQYCSNLLGAWQSRDTALNARNGLIAAAGVSLVVGAVATAWTLDLPTMIKGQPQTQVKLRPGGLVFSGTF